MLNPTIHRPNICSTKRKSANGTNSRTNRHAVNYIFYRRNSIRCGRCPSTSDMFANAFCVVSICICVRVLSAWSWPSTPNIWFRNCPRRKIYSHSQRSRVWCTMDTPILFVAFPWSHWVNTLFPAQMTQQLKVSFHLCAAFTLNAC